MHTEPGLLLRPSAVTPGVSVEITRFAPDPVSELVVVICETSNLALIPVNVTVIVPIPDAIVPTAVNTPLAPMLASASSAVSMWLTRVAFVALHEIGPVDLLLNLRMNVPPEIEPLKVSNCVSFTPLLGAAAV